jgi:hypothetical protein
MVFMQHGLMVSFWMSAGTIASFWLWRGIGRLGGRWWMCGLVFALALTTILCKSANSLVLLPIGISAYFFVRLGFGRALLFTMMLVPLMWIGARVSGLIPAEPIVAAVARVDKDRAKSLGARFEQEEKFGEKAMQQPVLGWGRWSRMFPVDEKGDWETRGVDGLWTITLGQYGIFGLLSTLALVLLGSFRMMSSMPSGPIFRNDPWLIALLLAVLNILSMVDCIFNAMMNPIFIVSSAALAGASLHVTAIRKSRPLVEHRIGTAVAAR